MRFIEEDEDFEKHAGIRMPIVFLIVLAGHLAVVGGILGYHRVKGHLSKEHTAGGPPIGFRVGGIATASDPEGRLRPVDREARSVDMIRLVQGASSPLENERSADPSPLDEGREGPIVAAAEMAQTTEAGGVAEHVVQHGDALTRIARQHGLSVGELRLANGLENDLIRIGQRLVVPRISSPQPASAPEGGRAYIVVRGDTLSAVARRFRVPMTALMQANGIQDANHLRVGRRLVIPSGDAGSGDSQPAVRRAAPSVAMSG